MPKPAKVKPIKVFLRKPIKLKKRKLIPLPKEFTPQVAFKQDYQQLFRELVDVYYKTKKYPLERPVFDKMLVAFNSTYPNSPYTTVDQKDALFHTERAYVDKLIAENNPLAKLSELDKTHFTIHNIITEMLYGFDYTSGHRKAPSALDRQRAIRYSKLVSEITSVYKVQNVIVNGIIKELGLTIVNGYIYSSLIDSYMNYDDLVQSSRKQIRDFRAYADKKATAEINKHGAKDEVPSSRRRKVLLKPEGHVMFEEYLVDKRRTEKRQAKEDKLVDQIADAIQHNIIQQLVDTTVEEAVTDHNDNKIIDEVEDKLIDDMVKLGVRNVVKKHNNEQEGKGIVDRIKNVFTNSSSPALDKLDQKYGSWLIKQYKVHRVPIAKGVKLALNAVSLGGIDSDAIKKLNYDDLYHLFAVFKIYKQGDNGNFKYFKTEKSPNISVTYVNSLDDKETSGSDTNHGNFHGGLVKAGITVHDMIENAKKKDGSNLYKYSGSQYNCQQYILTLLHSIGDHGIDEFVHQDKVSLLLKDHPITNKVANAVTDLGHVTNRVAQVFTGGRTPMDVKEKVDDKVRDKIRIHLKKTIL